MRSKNRLNLNKISKRKQRQKKKKLYVTLKIIGIAVALLVVLYLGYLTAGLIYNKINGNDVSGETASSEINGGMVATSEDKDKNLKTVSLYIPYHKIVDGKYMDIISQAKENGFNNIILEVKDDEGNIYFETSNEVAVNSGAVSKKAINLAELTKKLESLNMTLSVKVSAFKDNIMPSYDQSAAVCVNKGTSWLDSNYKRWINPYSISGTEYISSLCKEISSKYDVSEIVLSNVSFPDRGKTYLIDYEKSPQAISKEKVLLNFVESIKKSLGGDVKLGILEDGYYLYSDYADSKKGINKDILLSCDAFYPILNPSLAQIHMPVVTGEISLKNAEEDLYSTVSQLYKNCIKNNSSKCYIKPVIQGFDLNKRKLSPEDLRNQVKALNDNGQQYYVIYSMNGNVNFELFK